MRPDPKPESKRTLEIGCICEPISKQLAGMISEEAGKQLDHDNNAINHCYVRGYMDDRTTDRARMKLLKKCQDAAVHFAAASLARKPATA